MAECCNLILFVDANLSPPAHERDFMVTPLNEQSKSCCQPQLVSVGVQTMPTLGDEPSSTPSIPHPTPIRMRNYAYFPSGQQLQVPSGSSTGYLTDCMICGELFEQIFDWIDIEARRRAFFEGMRAVTYYLVPRGMFQAAACDGNVYAIPQGAVVTNTTPTNLPLLWIRRRFQQTRKLWNINVM